MIELYRLTKAMFVEKGMFQHKLSYTTSMMYIISPATVFFCVMQVNRNFRNKFDDNQLLREPVRLFHLLGSSCVGRKLYSKQELQHAFWQRNSQYTKICYFALGNCASSFYRLLICFVFRILFLEAFNLSRIGQGKSRTEIAQSGNYDVFVIRGSNLLHSLRLYFSQLCVLQDQLLLHHCWDTNITR